MFFVGLIFSSCIKENANTYACVKFRMTVDRNSMTKGSVRDSYTEFYSAMRDGRLIAESFNLILIEENTGAETVVNGEWDRNQEFILNTGRYHIIGKATAEGNQYIQDKCSFLFDEYINIGTETEVITLEGRFNCFLLIFNNKQFTNMSNFNGIDNLPLFEYNSYSYAFINTSLYNKDYKDKAYIEGTYNNNTFKYYTGNITFEKGKYYIYNEVQETFKFTTTLDGEYTLANNNVKVYGDSIYVNLEEPGMLYSLYKSYVDDKECKKEYGEEVWEKVKKVRIDGNIDARDFSTLKWNFRNLANLDLSNVKILEYYGKYGTVEGYEYSYSKNTIPIGAFFYWMTNELRYFPEELYDEGMSTLKKVKLPEGITKIERNAFARAYNLESINIPEGVKTIEMCAFRHCHSIENISIPNTVNEIGYFAFTDMNSLKKLSIHSASVPKVMMPFGFYYDGTNVDYFETMGFNRGTLYYNYYVKYNEATLYVPNGCKGKYESWVDFFNKVEEF